MCFRIRLMIILLVWSGLVKIIHCKRLAYVPEELCSTKEDPDQLTTKSSSDFSLWGFMTSTLVAATVLMNIISNLNNNNNNNNSNNNNLNSNSASINQNDVNNLNKNENMIGPAGRALEDSWSKFKCHFICQYQDLDVSASETILRTYLKILMQLETGSNPCSICKKSRS